MSKAKKGILWLVMLLCVAVVGFFFYEYESEEPADKSIVMSMDIDAERPFTAQVFWTESASLPFHEQQSVKAEVEAGQSHFETEFPASAVQKIRLDFGSNPGKVSVKNIQVRGANSVDLDVNQFVFFSSDIQNHEVIEDTLIIESDQPDPYVVYGPVLDVVNE